MTRIAIVGMACTFPDAKTPRQLWENVLAGRRAFRRLPDVRLSSADYYAADPAAPDRHYATHAAVIEGWEFDRTKHRVAAGVYRSTDIAHWLALDTAAAALEDAGFPEGERLDRARTGVVLGNTLTGDMTRANGMRLRWPYVRRTLAKALEDKGWTVDEIAEFVDAYEIQYKAPYPGINEDSLAGGLANTIAGRICNHFDFGGGGFIVDGACSSSLLAVANAGNALSAGQLDTAVVGGVDTSIDPFELVGFAKTGALATSRMTVYDRKSNGFWPGEGCGILVLVREEDAIARGLRSYATIAGWGVSSDGHGGISRPEADGHLLAMERAYQMAGFGAETVDYFEGHGTGTALGDRTELDVFHRVSADRPADGEPVYLGTVKGNIGHTKAAAGIAGLMKAALALHHGTIPPIAGNSEAHPILDLPDTRLRLPRTPRPWPTPRPADPQGDGAGDPPRRAGTSSLGFGGINAHVALESTQPPTALPAALHRHLTHTPQDTELLVLSAAGFDDLEGSLRHTADVAAICSYAELGDLSAELTRTDADFACKAAVVASEPATAASSLRALADAIAAGETHVFAPRHGRFLAHSAQAPRIGFLFPGQGAPGRGDGGAPAHRFEVVQDLYRQAGTRPPGAATEDAQPRIVTASLAGLRILDRAGISASGCVGHSLGELTGLYWAGVFDERSVVDIAAFRGEAMHNATSGPAGTKSGEAPHETGSMASIRTSAAQVEPLLTGTQVTVVGYNGPHQTVVAGPVDAVDAVVEAARGAGLHGAGLAVSHAFHTPLVAPAAHKLRGYLKDTRIGEVQRTGLFSTVTAEPVEPGTSVVDLLERQVVAPVRFADALERLAEECDLLIEVGPGTILSGLAAEVCPSVPVVSMDTDDGSVSGILRTLAGCYVLGSGPDLAALAAERFNRPLSLDKHFTFIESPCEQAPDVSHLPRAEARPPRAEAARGDVPADARSPLDTLRHLIAGHVELPVAEIRPETRPLDDLHLNSITITQLMGEVLKTFGAPMPEPSTSVATATIAELAEAIDDLAHTAGDGAGSKAVDDLTGIGTWVRPFVVEHVPTPLPPGPGEERPGTWEVFAPPGEPLAHAVRQRLEAAPVGDGVLLVSGASEGEDPADMAARMVDAARLAVERGTRLVVVNRDHSASALAKTVHLEATAVRTTIVDLADRLTPDQAASLVCSEVATTRTFREVSYDDDARRTEPVLRELATGHDGYPVGAGDVVVVTGGARGITVECAAALAHETGCTLALLGRADAAADAEVAANVARLRDSGAKVGYYSADVTDVQQVAAATEAIRKELGAITGILHGAGINTPVSIGSLTYDELTSTVAVKVGGFRNVLNHVDPSDLRLVVGFGSIIGRAGLRGEGHYATANDWLRSTIDSLGERLPRCRCLNIEWSVWSGTGMGERLGVLDVLTREGVEPIPTDVGVAVLLELLRTRSAPSNVVVLGRAIGLPTLTFAPTELPLLRFLERPVLHVPGIELIVEADLSSTADPYLDDHRLSGHALFPAVMGMEAMAQVASALFGEERPDEKPDEKPVEKPVEFRDIEFNRPIGVTADGTTTIRLAALRAGDEVQVAIRSAETLFHVDHFRGVCLRRDDSGPAPAGHQEASEPTAGTQRWDPLLKVADRAATIGPTTMDIEVDFYDRIMFHGPRFRSVTDFRLISARRCVARIRCSDSRWFSPVLPGALLLADPAARDAFMHALQVCVPDSTLLPSKIGRVRSFPHRQRAGELTLVAAERAHDGSTYVYDVVVRDEHGALVAIWESLELTAVPSPHAGRAWTPELLGPYLQRHLDEVLPEPLRLAVVRDHPAASSGSLRAGGTLAGPGGERRIPSRRSITERALAAAFGHPVALRHRPDGRPETTEPMSATHGPGLTAAVASSRPVGCDIEAVRERTMEQWRGLLGLSGVALAEMCGTAGNESFATAATRVWSAREAVMKLGVTVAQPKLILDEPARDKGWLVLRHGRDLVWTFAVTLAAPTPDEVIVIAVTEKG
ncbi:SDR family NAD(P)-dependent oxidoreductase [Streptomyces sp. NPDC046465]|uniref:SDR family NAD(P)-dependent oxidoreductase n=1 Tax=Streptomyces sp. NPDC046465 TaxID=3155810 RepID=UPI0033EAB1FD